MKTEKENDAEEINVRYPSQELLQRKSDEHGQVETPPPPTNIRSPSTADLDLIIESLKKGETLLEANVFSICMKLKELLVNETSVAVVQCPVTVAGDIHGQFHDLLELFQIGGDVPDTNYLFLGDYVDRGFRSVESVCLIISLKCRYKDRSE